MEEFVGEGVESSNGLGREVSSGGEKKRWVLK